MKLAVVVCLLVVCLLPVTRALKIAAFNIQRLSENTLTKTHDRLPDLVSIMRRYDIISVEEVMDEHGLDDVVHAMNSHGGGPYTMIKSPKTGRTRYKEYYAFVYRTDKVEVRSTHQYHDIHDWFEREPYAAKFHVPSAQLSDFVIAACHLKPNQVNPELGHLSNVYSAFERYFGTHNIMFNGDFNAGCHYLSGTKLQHNHFYQDKKFQWLLSSSVDTTASHHTNCAYDRFVVAGSEFQAAIVPHSAKVYNFERGMHLSFKEALAVSDHYPIEMEMKES